MELPITRATLNLTRACNLRCDYCFTHGCTYGRMSWETAKASVNMLVQNAIDYNQPSIEVSFWGGEPLLEWDMIKRICEYTKRVAPHGMKVEFGGTTNGVLLTPDKYETCDKYRLGWMVSIDGTQETHDRHRKTILGGGSHKIIADNCRLALKHWPWLKARFSPSVESVGTFFEDAKYLYEMGFDHLMFSPVHEGAWTEALFMDMEEQSCKLIDWMVEQNKSGRKLSMEHFNSYVGRDNSEWPCGAGRFYMGIDIDGGIYPCHRFCKFDDPRPWHKREVAVGHVDLGVTNPTWRDQFVRWQPGCKGAKDASPCFTNSPCHGGCYAVNYDLTGDIHTPSPSICLYVAMQMRVSQYYKACGLAVEKPRGCKSSRSCICHNMCYAEGTEEEIIDPDPSTNRTCICNWASYDGPLSPGAARSIVGR